MGLSALRRTSLMMRPSLMLISVLRTRSRILEVFTSRISWQRTVGLVFWTGWPSTKSFYVEEFFVFVFGVAAADEAHAGETGHRAVVAAPTIEAEPGAFVVDAVQRPERAVLEADLDIAHHRGELLRPAGRVEGF